MARVLLGVAWVVLGVITIAVVAADSPGYVVALVAWTGGILTSSVVRGVRA